MSKTIDEMAEELARKCWGYDGYYDDENGDAMEDTRALVPLIKENLIAAERRGEERMRERAADLAAQYHSAGVASKEIRRLKPTGDA